MPSVSTLELVLCHPFVVSDQQQQQQQTVEKFDANYAHVCCRMNIAKGT